MKLEIGELARQTLEDIKISGKQKQCYLSIRSFFMRTVAYMQKTPELNNLILDTLTCLHPDEKTKIISVQRITMTGNSLPCITPEELTVLIDELRVYTEMDIPAQWLQKDEGSVVRIDHYSDKVIQLKDALGGERFCVLAKVIKCAISLSHGNADTERSLSVNKKKH